MKTKTKKYRACPIGTRPLRDVTYLEGAQIRSAHHEARASVAFIQGRDIITHTTGGDYETWAPSDVVVFRHTHRSKTPGATYTRHGEHLSTDDGATYRQVPNRLVLNVYDHEGTHLPYAVTVGQGKGDDPQENDPNIDGIFGLTQDGAPYFFPWHTVESLNAPGVPTGKSTSGRREGNGWEIAVTR